MIRNVWLGLCLVAISKKPIKCCIQIIWEGKQFKATECSTHKQWTHALVVRNSVLSGRTRKQSFFSWSYEPNHLLPHSNNFEWFFVKPNTVLETTMRQDMSDIVDSSAQLMRLWLHELVLTRLFLDFRSNLRQHILCCIVTRNNRAHNGVRLHDVWEYYNDR